MNHIDEGTIHAWIDGALSAEQAREVEAHVEQCATCSASVAEARGLVAASSRILSALDDVPANVTPKKAPAPARAPKRQWRAARWVTGIAALLVAAVVLRTSSDVPREMQTKAATAPREAAGPVNEPVAQVAPPKATVTGATRAPEPAHDMVAASQPPRAEAKAVRASAPIASLGDRGATAVGGAASNVGLVDTARRRADANRNRAADVAAMAPQPSPLLRAPERITRVPELADSAFAGCYAMVDDRRGFMNTAATVAAEVVRPRAAAKTPASAPAAAPVREAVPSAPVLLQLDTVVQSAGYLARDGKTGASVGWWRRTAADSVRVDLLNGGVVAVRRGERRACPER